MDLENVIINALFHALVQIPGKNGILAVLKNLSGGNGSKKNVPALSL